MNKDKIKACLLENIDILAEVLEKAFASKCKFKVGDEVEMSGDEKPWIVVSLDGAHQRIRCEQAGDFGGTHYSWQPENELKLYKKKTFKPGDVVFLKYNNNFKAEYTVVKEDDGVVTCDYLSGDCNLERKFKVCDLALVDYPIFHSGDWVCLKNHPNVALEVISQEKGIVLYKFIFNHEKATAYVPADSLIYYGQDCYNNGDRVYQISDFHRTIPLTVVSSRSNEITCSYTVFGKNHTKTFYACNLMR